MQKKTRKDSDLQSAGEILAEMGFDKKAKQSTKAAFIKYLMKQAYGVDVNPPEIYKTNTTENPQLSFGFDDDKSKVG